MTETIDIKDDAHVEHHTSKRKTNIYAIISIVLLIAVVVLGYMMYKSSFNSMSEAEVNTYVKAQLDKMLAGQATVNITNVKEENGMYTVNMTVDGQMGAQDLSVYVTKDGSYMFMQAIDLKNIPDAEQQKKDAEEAAKKQQEEELKSVAKSDRPKAELFIMSYCPYGLQAEKAFLPVMGLLKTKADLTINFVDYAMHGEKEVYENLRQYCIQKDQDDKFITYLTCFVQEDNYSKCLLNASIDMAKLDACTNATDVAYNITTNLKDKTTWLGNYPPFNTDKEACDVYGVQGSPTLVINGKQVNVNRNPEAIKQAVCAAFNTAPEECDTVLSTDNAAPSFGPLGAKYTSDIAASCG